MIGADRAAPDTPLIALLAAAGRGDAAGVAAILDAHPDLVNQRDALLGNTGLRTALHFGVGHLAVVKKQPSSLAALIDLGAELNIEDAFGLTPLDQAALDGEDEMARLLIAAGTVVTLPAAIVLGHEDRVDELVRADPEVRPSGARTLARRQTFQRAERIVTFLQSACWDHHIHGKGDHRMHDRAAQRRDERKAVHRRLFPARSRRCARDPRRTSGIPAVAGGDVRGREA